MKRFYLLISIFMVLHFQQLMAQEIFPEQRGKVWGYVSDDSTVVIPFIYEEARDFEEGVAWVKMQSKWGVIDKKGNQIFPFEFDEADYFIKGLAMVKKEGRYGLAATSGKMFLPCMYDEVLYPYSKQKKYIAVVYIGEVKGMVRPNGTVDMPDAAKAIPAKTMKLEYLKLALLLPDGWRADGFGGDIGNWEEGGSSVCDCAGVIVDNVPQGNIKMVIYPYLIKNAENPKRLMVWDYTWEQNRDLPAKTVKAKNLSFTLQQGHWMLKGEKTKMEVLQGEALSGQVGYRIYIWNDNAENGNMQTCEQYIQLLLDSVMALK
jgi:WG containing repeat